MNFNNSCNQISLNMCHIMFTSHALTWLFYREVEAMVVESQLGEEASKPVTTVQDCVSTFLSVKPLDIVKETSG